MASQRSHNCHAYWHMDAEAVPLGSQGFRFSPGLSRCPTATVSSVCRLVQRFELSESKKLDRKW